MEDHKKHKNGKGRLVLVSSPFQGHMTPILQLANILHTKYNFSITISHIKLNSPNPSNHPDFDFLPLTNDKVTSTDGAAANLSRFLQDLNNGCEAEFRRWLEGMKGVDDRVVGVIYDNLMYFSGSVAKDFDVPNVLLRTSSASYVPAYFAIHKLVEQGLFPPQDSMLEELVPELHPLRFKDLPFIRSSVEEILRLPAILTQLVNPSAVICNTVDFLEHPALLKLQEHFKVSVFSVGPLHIISQASSTSYIKEDTSCIPWLNNQSPKSVLYVSLGSLATTNEKDFVETAWGLANSGQPFLWVVRPGSVSGSEWIELLPKDFMEEIKDRGWIVKWAPQKEVLAHKAVGGFWSHCGWNSTLESLAEGVPMICKPYSIDQGVNTRYISEVWEVGFELEHLERGEIEKTIRRLMVDKEGEEVRRRAFDVKGKIEAAVSEGGSSNNSLNDLVHFISTHA